jgi:hypothetical protein
MIPWFVKMKNGQERKNINITIPVSVHQRIKADAALRGQPVHEIYAEALLYWLNMKPHHVATKGSGKQ